MSTFREASCFFHLFFFTRYWCVHSVGCYLSRVLFLSPCLRPCSSPLVASSPCLSRHLCDKAPVMTGSWTRSVWGGWGSLFWPLCQSTQNQLHISPKETVRQRVGTRIPRVSHQAGRTFGPGRWQRWAPRWHSWSPGAQSPPAPGQSSRHLVEGKYSNISLGSRITVGYSVGVVGKNWLIK